MYTLIAKGGGLGTDLDEITIFSMIPGQQPRAKAEDVWIAERRIHDSRMRQVVAAHQWIDGRTCPALRAALQTIGQLPPMRFGTPENFTIDGLASDVPITVLRGPPAKDSGGGMQLSLAEYLGPLADWRVATEERVARCWRDAPVTIPGVKILERLATDAEAEVLAR